MSLAHPDLEFDMTDLAGPSQVSDPVPSRLVDISPFPCLPYLLVSQLVVLIGGKFESVLPKASPNLD